MKIQIQILTKKNNKFVIKDFLEKYNLDLSFFTAWSNGLNDLVLFYEIYGSRENIISLLTDEKISSMIS